MIPLPITQFYYVNNWRFYCFRATLGSDEGRTRPGGDTREFFEFFSANRFFRDYQLDPKKLKSGIVGQASTNGKGRWRIDSMYLFVNGKLIRMPSKQRPFRLTGGLIAFDIIIIQSKRSGGGFDIHTLNRFSNTSESIFSIDKQPTDFAKNTMPNCSTQ